MATIDEKIFEATKTLNNIKNHDFSVADYKMCENESEIVRESLSVLIGGLHVLEGKKNEPTV